MGPRRIAAFVAVMTLAAGSAAWLSPSAIADSAPPLSINDVTAIRPTSGTTNFVFTVTLGYPSLNTVNVNYATSDGSARSTFDYQPAAGVLIFAPGQLTKTVTVVVNGTTLHTGDRSFYVGLSSAINATLLHPTGTGTIQDDNPNPYVNIADATVVQGDGTSNSAQFAVSLTSASANKVSVKYATSDGSARAGIDYTKASGTLKFNPGATSAQVTVPIIATSVFSATRTFYVTLSSAVNATVERNQASGAILNDNHTAYVTVDDAAVKKPGSGTATMNFAVRLGAAATFPVTLNYATSDNSATVAGGDYLPAAGTATIPAGSTQALVPVTINGNGIAGNKSLYLSVSNVSAGASVLRSSGLGTIVGPAAYSQFAVGDVSIVAPTSGTASLQFTVSLTPVSTSATSVLWATSDNSAIGGTHYTPSSGTLNFAAGVASKTMTVPILTDKTQFTDVNFIVNLSSATGGAVIDRSQAYGVIEAANLLPNLSITPIAIPLPTSGTGTATWTVTLTPPSMNQVTVNYATADGSATAANGDYVATSGTLTFAAGVTSKTFSATVNANTKYFGTDEYFYVNLSGPTNATLQNSQAYTYLQNLNKAPTLSVGNLAVYRPLTASTIAKFPVTLSGASVNTVTVQYSTSDGTAVSGIDYTPASGTLTFAPGVTTQSVSVKVLGTNAPVGNRYFYLSLSSPTNAGLVNNVGQANIVDDTITPLLSINSPSVVRPASGTAPQTFTVTMTSPSANTVTVHYATSDNNAVSGLDYTPASGTLSFAPGVTTQNVNVPVLARTVKTGDLSFYVSLSAATNAALGGQYYNLGYILDPNFSPGLSVDDVVVNRPTSGTTTETFTVTLAPASPNTVTVNYATSNNSAVSGVDYTPASGTLTFAPGVTSQTASVTILGIATSTPDRSYYFSLSSALNAQLVRTYAYGIIVDTVPPVSGLSYLSVSDATVVKPSSGTANESFVISMRPAASAPVTVSYATSDGSAVAGVDYTSTRGSVTFNAGQTSKTVTVPVIGNTLPSADRYFYLGIYANTAPSYAFRSSGTGLIIENQVSSRVSVGPDLAVIKGDSGTQTMDFTVSLNAPQAFTVQVDYTTQDGSARAPESYSPVADTLTFSPGQTTKTVSVIVNSNTFILPTQYFYLTLSNAQNTVIGGNNAVGFIYNADVFNIKGSVVDQNGAAVAGVTITRSGNNQPTVTTTTAGNGSFTVPNSLGGTYTVTPTLAGKTFLPASVKVTVLGGDVTGQNFLAYVAGPTTVTGVVQSTSGLGGVTITRTGGGQPTATATTTSFGYFAFVGLPPANGYVFTPTLASYAFNPTSVTANIDGTTTVAMFDIVPVQATYITGRVTKAGNGVAGVTITRTGAGQPTATVKTNSQGYYGFTKVPVVVANRTFTITPSATGKTFTPPSANAIVNTTTNATGVDFVEN